MGIKPNLRARLDTLQTGRLSGAVAVFGMRATDTRRILLTQDRRYRRDFGPIVDHPSARQVRRFDEKAWEQHFKFTFVRNPYARMASLYFYLTRKSAPPRMPFSEFVPKLLAGSDGFANWSHLGDTWPLYTIEDRIVVDFVGRFERLDADFLTLCDRLNIPRQNLGQTKVAAKYDFRELYDPDTRRLVEQVCGREIEHFGYRFES